MLGSNIFSWHPWCRIYDMALHCCAQNEKQCPCLCDEEARKESNCFTYQAEWVTGWRILSLSERLQAQDNFALVQQITQSLVSQERDPQKLRMTTSAWLVLRHRYTRNPLQNPTSPRNVNRSRSARLNQRGYVPVGQFVLWHICSWDTWPGIYLQLQMSILCWR